MNRTVIFVYGTLKRGQINNALLSGQQFLGPAKTMPLYRLYHLDWHPGMVVDKAKGIAIKGELWSVDDNALEKLDILEGVPIHFTRDFVAIANHAGDVQGYLFAGEVPADASSGDDWPFRS